jgi:threonine dehydratase
LVDCVRRPIEAPSRDAIERARERIRGTALRTPLVRLDVDAPFELWIKLENLQPIGSFKLRGALNAIRSLSPERLNDGVYTASAGNMAQGVAWGAREAGVSCTVIAPDTAPAAKIDAITRLGAKVISVTHQEWWQVMVDHGHPDMRGEFIHPVANNDVLAGNATIGAEIFEDLPDASVVFVPHGGGGQAVGVASAAKALGWRARVIGCEVETAAPYTASRAAGAPATIEFRPSFVDGIGSRSVLAEMWPLTSTMLDESVVVSVPDVANAIRLLVRRARVVAEGAGATPVAAALSEHGASIARGARRCVAIVSGGNIDSSVLSEILANRL